MKKKFETMFTVHVRYDINNEDYSYGNDISQRIQQAVQSYIQQGLQTDEGLNGIIYFAPKNNFTHDGPAVANAEPSTSGDNTLAKITFSQIVDSVTDFASENRHSPNVWFVGGLRNLRTQIRVYMNNRTVMKNSPLAVRARQFDASEPSSWSHVDNRDYYTLPILPNRTMELAIQRTRNNESRIVTDGIAEQLQEQVLDILDGLFEDGLPVQHDFTPREARVATPEPF